MFDVSKWIRGESDLINPAQFSARCLCGSVCDDGAGSAQCADDPWLEREKGRIH